MFSKIASLRRSVISLFSHQSGLQNRVLRGGAWLVAGDMVNRVAGIIKMAFLARLLAPTDFGIIAMANLVLTWFDYFSQTGFASALIHKKEDIHPYLDTYWTVQAARGLGLYALGWICAPWVSLILHTPELTTVLRASCVVLIFRGFWNPAIVYLRKELKIEREAAWRSIGALVGLAVAIPIGFVYRNVWALVISILATDLTVLILSYTLVRYRPRIEFNRERSREMMRFGKWIFWQNLGIYVHLNAATWVIGRYFGAVEVGYYQLAQQFGATPFVQVAAHIIGISFPAFAKLHDQASRRSAFLRSVRFVSVCILPLAALMTLFAPLVVRIVLGQRWMPVAPLLRILVVGAALSGLAAVMRALVASVGRPRVGAQASLLTLVTMGTLLYPMGRYYGVIGIATAVLISNVVMLAYLFVFSASVLGWKRDLVTVYRHALLASIPVIAAALVVPFCRSIWSSAGLAFVAFAVCAAIVFRQLKSLLRRTEAAVPSGVAV